jgi:hypothetical protein
MTATSSDVVAPLSLGLERMPYGGSSCYIVPAWPLTTASLTWCRNGTAGHPSVDGGQLRPGPTIALGPFLQLSVVPYG